MPFFARAVIITFFGTRTFPSFHFWFWFVYLLLAGFRIFVVEEEERRSELFPNKNFYGEFEKKLKIEGRLYGSRDLCTLFIENFLTYVLNGILERNIWL